MEASLTNGPLAVYVTGLVAAVLVVTAALPKVAKQLAELRSTLRAGNAEADDADLAEAQRIIRNLREQLEQERADHAQTRQRYAAYRREWAVREARWRTEKRVLDLWIHKVATMLIGHEPPVDIAPDYMTPDPLKEDQ